MLDRQYQFDLLTLLLKGYPTYTDVTEKLVAYQNENPEKYKANMLYLQDYGLVKGAVSCAFCNSSEGKAWYEINIQSLPVITNKGIDFVLSDGGLGAILGVQTVKLHDETIKEFWKEAIYQSRLEEEKKNWLSEKFKNLSLTDIINLAKEVIPIMASHIQ